MSIFKQRVKYFQKAKEKKEQGKVNCLPFPESLPKLSEKIPGIIKGTYYCVTANTGEGKTQFTKFLFVKSVFKFIKENPNSGINPRVIYFALEESKQDFIDSIIIDELWERHGVRLDHYDLESMRSYPISDDILNKIKELEEYFADFEQFIEIVDTVSNPTGIYKHIREHSKRHGTHYWTQLYLNDSEERRYILDREFKSLKEGKNPSDNPKEKGHWKYSHYEPTDPDELVICIADHLSLLSVESGAFTLHEAMGRLSSNYVLAQVIKHYKYAFVGVHQQVMSGQNIDHLKANLLYPTLGKLGDNKLIGRDYMVVFGLFQPYKHGLTTELDYDIKSLKQYFTSLYVLKHRKGQQNFAIGMFFDGGTRNFKELPPANDRAGMQQVYNYINRIEN